MRGSDQSRSVYTWAKDPIAPLSSDVSHGVCLSFKVTRQDNEAGALTTSVMALAYL